MNPRGQATLELSLGALLTVTLIFGALYFGELTFIGMKLTEAGSHSVYEASGLRIHSFQNPTGGAVYRPLSDVKTALKPGGALVREYEDLDGMSDVTDGSGYQLGWTATSQVVNKCRSDSSIRFRIPNRARPYRPGARPDPYWGSVRNQARSFFRDVGGFSCTSSASVDAINIPQTFMERGGANGFFKRDHWTAQPVTLCAFGRASGGKCRGELGILLGDWSLGAGRGSNQNMSVRLRDNDPGPRGGSPAKGGNKPYYAMVRALVNDNGSKADAVSRGRAASRFATWANAEGMNPKKSPHDESAFRMSFVGVEGGSLGPYRDYPYGTTGKEYYDVTGGVYDPNRIGLADGAYKRLRVRGGCFLGRGKPNEDCAK